MKSLLEVANVSAGYDSVRVLKDVSVNVQAGSITALVGSNGAGKTTLMRVIAGLIPATSGVLRLDGSEITSLAAHHRVELGISLVPEGRLIFPTFTVAENLAVGGFARRVRRRRREIAEEMFKMFPRLRERRRVTAQVLSGGEQQMLAIGRALMARPRLLLLDEPSLGLAPGVVRQLFDIVQRIHRDGGTIFIVEQNVRTTLELADYAYVLENGEVVTAGPAGEILRGSRVKSAYLGL